MKLPSILLAAATALALPALATDDCDVRDKRVVRDGSALSLAGKPWKAVGPNVYWMGIDENIVPPPPGRPFYAPLNTSYPTKGRVTEVMEIVHALGGTMMRAHTLGINIGNPLTLMPRPGHINLEAFKTIDWAIFQARQAGLRLMVPLVDNYDYYHGGKYNFLRWNGYNLSFPADANDPQIQKFWHDRPIVDSFKWYVTQLLTHRNHYTGLTLAKDPTVFAIESGNELYGPEGGDMDCPASWVREIAQHVKSLAPDVLFMDGTYGINATHLDIDEVDMYSDHFYPCNITKLQQGLDKVASVNKTYFAGEYDWTGLNGGDDLRSWYKVLEESPVAAGDTFWSLFGRNVPNCNQWVNHTDGFSLSYKNPADSEHLVAQMKLVRQHHLIMSEGRDVGPDSKLADVRCPVGVGKGYHS